MMSSRILSNSESFVLDGNNFSTLQANLFEGLEALTTLYLFSNNIESLDEDTFYGLTNLKILYLHRNSIASLDKGLFDGLTYLSQLALSYNSLSSLPSDLFQARTALTTLNLNNNRIASPHVDLFAGLTDLTTLNLSNNSIASPPEDLFNGLAALSALALNNNGIESLPAGLFAGLMALKTLNINNNSIVSPPAGLFAGLTALSTLNLNNNRIASPHVDLFDGLTTLTTLNLSNNSMASPPEDLFDETTALTSLNLSNNGMASPHVNLFDGLTALTSLNLSNNSMASPHVELFDGITGLLRLYLNDNSLSTLDVDLFDGLVDLRTLDLTGNSITGLTAGVFEDLDVDMKSLYLRSNRLASLPAGIFDGLTGLLDLDLSCNRLTALDPARVTPFASTLDFLEISGNSFTTQPTVAGLALTKPNVNLYTGANTVCGPPDDTGTSEVSISPGSYTTGAETTRVAHDVSATTITITARDPNATIEPYPANFEPVYDDDPNTPGWQVRLPSNRNGFQWLVRAKNGFNFEIGGLVVYRAGPPGSEARLHSLALSGVTLAEAFDNDIQSYAATAAAGLTETTVTAPPLDPDATAVIKVNGMEDADGTVALRLGENAITVEVIAEDGSTMRTYTVTVMLQGTVSFGSGEYSVTEGAGVEVTVELSHALPGNASITITLQPSDIRSMPDDYTVPETITFGANETSASFIITATQDTEVESDESVAVFLQLPISEEIVIYGEPDFTIVNIVDDDSPGVTITPRTLDVDEGSNCHVHGQVEQPPHRRRYRGHNLGRYGGGDGVPGDADLHAHGLEHGQDGDGDGRLG